MDPTWDIEHMSFIEDISSRFENATGVKHV
jgi:hypothetical protein